MAADGGERAYLRVLAAHDQERFARDVDPEPVAGIRNFRGAADGDPVAAEDALPLRLEYLGRGVETGRQRGGLRKRAQDGAAAFFHQG